VSILSEQLNLAHSKMEELAKIIDSEDARKRKEMEDLKSLSKLKELEL